MPDVTVLAPTVGTEAYFTFKEPINYYIQNKLNISNVFIKIKVISVISMRDTIHNDLRDPYTDLYLPANIKETEYKQDLIDNVPIVSFLFKNSKGINKYFRVPLAYISSMSEITDIEYNNKLIVLDLNKLPAEYDTTVFFQELKNFIETRVGIVPSIKEVSIGEVELVDNVEHEIRETVRQNMITVYKTLSVRLEEITIKHDQLLNRLQALNITLN